MTTSLISTACDFHFGFKTHQGLASTDETNKKSLLHRQLQEHKGRLSRLGAESHSPQLPTHTREWRLWPHRAHASRRTHCALKTQHLQALKQLTGKDDQLQLTNEETASHLQR